MVNVNELLEKYQALLSENLVLKEENETLKARLRLVETPPVPQQELNSPSALSIEATGFPGRETPSGFLCRLDPQEKIRLFMSLFKGREDVYAKRWQNREGRAGYAPVCRNEWKTGICRKPAIKCFDCRHQTYDILNEKVIEAHLRGNIVAGIYPLRRDEMCHLLAIDFDDEGWQRDCATLREVCVAFGVPMALERSRSGSGAHAWFFFEEPIPASLARRFGFALLTCAMSRRHEVTFKSYDRFFPNQDTLPKGGFGNLIALPLQKAAREQGHSVFLNENFEPCQDQWEFMANIEKLSEVEIMGLIPRLSPGSELGVLRKDEEETEKPWETKRIRWSGNDFPQEVRLVKANMLYIEKAGISQQGLNTLKRLAAFRNPEFYKAQAMRMSTYGKPPIISCSEETTAYLCLPRGCEADVANLLDEVDVKTAWSDHTCLGRPISVAFNGNLREEQNPAAEEMLKHDIGVLSATTAFGKTVIAAKLIAERKVSTLVLTHRRQLLSQWTAKLSEFLEIDEALPVLEKKRGRKKKQSLIGQIGAGKSRPSGIIDVAIMQSLNSGDEVKELVKNYGMVIVDECHHVPAFSFEQILKGVHAKYVYGLTATPTRQDGHHPIIFMHCGPIRYRVDARKQAEKRPFNHYVIPRLTSFRAPLEEEGKEPSIQRLYAAIVVNETRNQRIVEDIVRCFRSGGNALVLTERTAHVALLAAKLREQIPDVIALTGGKGAKETRETLAKVSTAPADRPLTLIATGRYIGEGFDEPRLDTLFLAMPISWKGTLQQYAGRLHRLYEGKREVRVYDYIDVHVPMLEKMYHRRLTGYAAIGYKARAEIVSGGAIDIIFDNTTFLSVYQNDLVTVAREILIVSPFVTRRRVSQMLPLLVAARERNVTVVVVTRPASDFREKDRASLEETLSLFHAAGINVMFKSNIHQKFAIFDQKIVWYGSINLLSFGRSEESIMRLENPNIADELLGSIQK
ncbi:MAG: DEAD/DEAH box helicase family protein [Syntrophobacterales bacterium]|nr:DEAD/DEAH box helicase family protein [Syntrophobacterales bacterium]